MQVLFSLLYSFQLFYVLIMSFTKSLVLCLKYYSMFHPTAAGQPGNLNAWEDIFDPTSIRVSWIAPTSGANVTGYRIYWSGGSDQGSMDANAGDSAVTIRGRTYNMVYTITIVALSNLLPSQTDMVEVTGE